MAALTLRIIGYSEKDRAVYVLRSGYSRFTGHSMFYGWRVYPVSVAPRVLSLYTLTAEARYASSRGTASLFKVNGETYGVTALHVFGAPWESHVGKRFTVEASGRAYTGEVVAHSTVKEYTEADYEADLERQRRGEIWLSGENESDSALFRVLGGAFKGVEIADGSIVGMVVAGSVADKLSIVLPIASLPFDIADFKKLQARPEAGDCVYKHGVASGVTRGVVEAREAKIIVSYRCGSAVFKNAFIVRGVDKPFSVAGDSGSIVLLGGGRC